MALFDAPIPGQSLTDTPKNRPYERPPEIVDPEEALQAHLLKLSDPDRMGAVMDLLEQGVDLVTLTEGILRKAVMNGIHSIDVSLVIAPVIHEYIKITADEVGIDYEEGFENKEEKGQLQYNRREMKAMNMLKKMGMNEPVEVQEEVPVEQATPEVKPAGLMARGV